jgi:hypothetical protein
MKVLADLSACLPCCCRFVCCAVIWRSVNAAGTSYTVDAAGNIVVTTCPQDTYGPGMKKQRSCVPCPSGYTTRGATGQTTAAACGKSLLKMLRWLP